MIARPRTALLVLFFYSTSPLAAFAGETVTYLHHDNAGSTVAATDAGGLVVWRERFQPYGARLDREAAAAEHSEMYAGHQDDAATGLTYMGARYYDPVVGRFMGMDPAEIDPHNPHGSRYNYANNNPYAFVDPDGRAGILIGLGVAAVAVVAYGVYSAPGWKAYAQDFKQKWNDPVTNAARAKAEKEADHIMTSDKNFAKEQKLQERVNQASGPDKERLQKELKDMKKKHRGLHNFWRAFTRKGLETGATPHTVETVRKGTKFLKALGRFVGKGGFAGTMAGSLADQMGANPFEKPTHTFGVPNEI